MLRKSFSLVRAKLFRPLVEPNAFQFFCFDLADAFAGDAKFAADFFKRVANAGVGETIAHFQNFPLLR